MPSSPCSILLATSLLLGSVTSQPCDYVNNVHADCQQYECSMNGDASLYPNYSRAGYIAAGNCVGWDGLCGEEDSDETNAFKCTNYCNQDLSAFGQALPVSSGDLDPDEQVTTLFTDCVMKCNNVTNRCEEEWQCSIDGRKDCTAACNKDNACYPTTEAVQNGGCDADTICDRFDKDVYPEGKSDCKKYDGSFCGWSNGCKGWKTQDECDGYSDDRDRCERKVGCYWFKAFGDGSKDCNRVMYHRECIQITSRGDCKKSGCKWKSNSDCDGNDGNQSDCEDDKCFWDSSDSTCKEYCTGRWDNPN